MLDLPPTVHCNTFLDLAPPTPLSIGLEFRQKPLFVSDADWAYLQELKARAGWDFDLLPALPYLRGEKSAVVVTDPAQRITWVSRGFTRMTGYARQEACGRHPRFLQGKRTQPDIRLRIRQHLHEGRPFSGTIINYRKSGQPYACALDLFPLYDHGRNLVSFMALEKEEPLNFLSF